VLPRFHAVVLAGEENEEEERRRKEESVTYHTYFHYIVALCACGYGMWRDRRFASFRACG